MYLTVTELDFERLFSSQMEWSSNPGWKIEHADRFIGDIDWDYKYIYWFENYVEALIASQFLITTDFKYMISYDGNMECYVIVTDYAADWVK